MVFSNEFKAAVRALPLKEKEQLLFRLLKKDERLVRRLEFELVSELTVDEARAAEEEKIRDSFSAEVLKRKTARALYYLTRSTSAEITDYVFITKDKFGEVYLNLLMLSLVLESAGERMWSGNEKSDGVKLQKYWIGKLLRQMILTLKLDGDYDLELNPLFEHISSNIQAQPTATRVLTSLNFPLQWLNAENIPEDIEGFYKKLRLAGKI